MKGSGGGEREPLNYTMFMVLSVTYYLELLCAINFYYGSHF